MASKTEMTPQDKLDRDRLTSIRAAKGNIDEANMDRMKGILASQGEINKVDRDLLQGILACPAAEKIDTAIKDRLKRVLEGKGKIIEADRGLLRGILESTVDFAYKGAYDYAVRSVMKQINLLPSMKKEVDYPAYISEAIAAHNLETLNKHRTTPMVQFEFKFVRGGEELTVNLNYDNPGHDPKKTLTALFGKEMEINPETTWGKGHEPYLDASFKNPWDMYPHFGWVLSYGKESWAGHAYITFSAMLMDRASRSKDVQKDTHIIKPSRSKLSAKNDINCDVVSYSWINYATMRIEIESQTASAAEKLKGLKQKKGK